MFEFVGKVALITGGISGIGLSTAIELLRGGLKAVSLVDIREELGLKVIEEINTEFGEGKALFLKADVTDKTKLEDAFKKTIQNFNNLDIVINAAGILKDAKWEKEIAVNVNGTVNGTLLAFEDYLPKYRSGAEGVVLNVASIAGLDVFDFMPIYCATKCAVLGLTRCFGSKMNYERSNIKVLAICPGFTTTPLLQIDSDSFMGPIYNDLFRKGTEDIVFQPTDFVAKAIARVIAEGEPGSAWVVEEKEPAYEIEFRCRKECKKLTTNMK